MKHTVKGLMTALAITVGAAGALSVPASIAIAPPAEAFGLSDIGGAIKSAGKKVGSAAKKAGKAVGKGAKKAGKAVGKGVKTGVKGVGTGVYWFGYMEYIGWREIGKGVGRGAKWTAGKTWDGTKWVGRQANKSAIVRGVVQDGKAAGKWIGRNAKKGAGKTWDGTKWVGRQAKKSDIVKGVINDAKKIGRGIKSVAGKLRATAPAPRENSISQSIRNKRGLVSQKRFQTQIQRDRIIRGNRAKKFGNKRMTLGIVPNKRLPNPGRTVQGITKDNLKPSRKVKGFNTRDIKIKRDRGTKRESFQKNRKRKQSTNGKRGRKTLGSDRRGKSKFQNKRSRRKQNNRRGRRG